MSIARSLLYLLGLWAVALAQDNSTQTTTTALLALAGLVETNTTASTPLPVVTSTETSSTVAVTETTTKTTEKSITDGPTSTSTTSASFVVTDALTTESTTVTDQPKSQGPKVLPPTYRVFFKEDFTTTTTTTTTSSPELGAAVDPANVMSMDAPVRLLPTAPSDSVTFRMGVGESATESIGKEDASANVSISFNVAESVQEGTEKSEGAGGAAAGGGGGDFLSGLFGGGGGGMFGGGGGGGSDEGNLKCFSCESCPKTTDMMRKETCLDFSALCVTKVQYAMRRGKLFYVRKSRFCGPSSCPPSSLMSRFQCCSGDLCNGAQPVRITGSTLVLIATLMAATSLARLF